MTSRVSSRAPRNPRISVASEVASNVLIYEGDAVRAAAASPDRARPFSPNGSTMTEGPGIVVFRGAFDDLRPWTRPPITSGP